MKVKSHSKIYTKTIIISVFKGMYEHLSDQIKMYLTDGGDVVYMKKVADQAEYEKWLVAIKKDWDCVLPYWAYLQDGRCTVYDSRFRYMQGIWY